MEEQERDEANDCADQSLQAHLEKDEQFLACMNICNQKFEELTQLFGRYPTIDEICTHTGNSIMDVEHCLRLDVPFESLNDEALAVSTMGQGQRLEIWEALGTLSERERIVLIQYFGLDGKGVRTFEKIGKSFRRTKSLTSRVYRKAMRKLRTPYRKNMSNGKFSGLLST